MGRVVSKRQVQDPSETDANYYADRARNPHDRNIGKVWVEENAMTRMGALCFVERFDERTRKGRRHEHHERVAAEFKDLYERKYGSPAASDPGKVQVDTSHRAHDSGMAANIDNGRRIYEAERFLGKADFDLLLACVVMGIPAGDMPKVKKGWRARKRKVDDVLAALDKLAEHWGYRMRVR